MASNINNLCKYDEIRESVNELHYYRCQHCNHERSSKYPPEMLRRSCPSLVNPAQPQQPKKLLGDHIEAALKKVGITEEWLTEKLGVPCGCKWRKEMTNQVDAWARRVVGGNVAKAKEYLQGIFEEPK